jgi:DNA-binding transcriptional regulator YiaG
MEESLFDIEMTKATVMVEVENHDYWSGYIRGLKRRFKGENFGTSEEHGQWLAHADSDAEELREKGRGYRHGYLGPIDFNDPANAVVYLRKWQSWSVDELAGKAGVTPDIVNEWENGRMPTPQEIRKLEELMEQQ